jgi:pimeloyl-ACP methyl ester carboxylesterase
LLLHGNPSWSFLYRKIIIELRRDVRCVAPDFPGYGMSDAPAGYGYTPAEHCRGYPWPRKTRSRLLARLYRTGLVTRWVPSQGFRAAYILPAQACPGAQ